MKTKTSVTLSPEMLCEIDRAVGERGSRSAFIERVLAKYFRTERRIASDRHDAEIYARMAAEPNPENADLLEYLADVSTFGDDIEVLKDEAPLSEAG
jgi:metal-responsive CopG/Arc/MetJ family transcriptional regulator